MKKVYIIFAFLLTTLQLFAQMKEFVWDTIKFEKPYEYLEIDTSNQNIWQIGEPAKVFFDSAFSLTNAILTDTLNFYPLNNNSYFDLKIGEFNYSSFYWHDVFIEIKHKFDTDTLKDGGFITVSYDAGLTWTNIINDTFSQCISPGNHWEGSLNLYDEEDTLFNGEFGFSGHSDDWVTTWFAWYCIPCGTKSNSYYVGDTMIVRFNFISDSIENNREGWMIDNIKLYSVDLGGGIDDIKSLEFNIFPNPINETATVELSSYKEIELTVINIQGQVIKQEKYFNNQPIVIERSKLKSGIYFVKIRTSNNSVGIKKLIVR